MPRILIRTALSIAWAEQPERRGLKVVNIAQIAAATEIACNRGFMNAGQ
jgi:hypothetical protein